MAGPALCDFHIVIVPWWVFLDCIVTVALDAPAHVELGCDLNLIHLFDFQPSCIISVALVAVETARNVRPVAETDVVREVVYFHQRMGTPCL